MRTRSEKERNGFSLSLSIVEKVCRCKFEKFLTLIKIFSLMKNAFHASPTMTNVYIYISVFDCQVSFNSLTLFHVGTFHLFTPIKGRKPVGISPRSKERGRKGGASWTSILSAGLRLFPAYLPLLNDLFFFAIPQADSTPALINSHHRYTVNTGTKKWKIFRVIPDPFDSSNSFFFLLQNPSIYRDCLFLARFLSLRSILFQIFQLPLCKVSKVFISIFPSSFFKFSFANSYLFCDISFPLSHFFDFPSPFSQSIQSIYCDFSSFFKFPFTNNVFITIFLRFLSSVSIIQLLFCKVSKVFIAIFPRPFPFVLYPSPIFLFRKLFFSIYCDIPFLSFCIHPPSSFRKVSSSIYCDIPFLSFCIHPPFSFRKVSSSIYYHCSSLVFPPVASQLPRASSRSSSAETMISLHRPDSSLRDSFRSSTRCEKAKIPRKFCCKRRFITATAVEFSLFSPALLLLLPLSPTGCRDRRAPSALRSAFSPVRQVQIQREEIRRRPSPHCIEFVIPPLFYARISATAFAFNWFENIERANGARSRWKKLIESMVKPKRERERDSLIGFFVSPFFLHPFQFLSLAFKYSRSILTVPNIIEVRKRRGEKEESKKLSHCLSSTPIILTVLRTFDRCNRYAQAYRVILLSRTPLRFLKGNNRGKLFLVVEKFLFFFNFH